MVALLASTSGTQRVQDAISESHQLSLCGHFDAATDVLAPVLQDCETLSCDQIELQRAKARIMVLRGYPQRAKECLETALRFPQDGISKNKHLALQVHLVFVTTVCCGEDVDSAKHPEEAEHMLSGLRSLDDFDRDSVEMLSHIYRMSIVKRIFCHRRLDTSKDRVLPRIRVLLEQALALGRWDDIYTLSVPFFQVERLEAADQWLHNVLSYEGIPPVYRALLNLQLADQLASTMRLDDLKACLDEAEKAFRSCSHAFGLLQVRGRRLDHGLIASPNVLCDLIEVLNEYIRLDYPYGVLHASMSPLTLAFKSGNHRAYVHLHEVFHSISKYAGIRHETVLLENQLLAMLNAGTGHFGKVVELGRPLFQACKAHRYWTIAYYVGSVLSLAYHQAAEHEAAEQYALEIYNMCCREGLQNSSEAIFHLANTRASRQTRSVQDRVLLCREVVNLLEPSVEQDVQDEDVELACRKLQFVATLQFELSGKDTVNHDAWISAMLATMQTARDSAQRLPEDARLDVNGNCDDLTITHLLSVGRNEPNHNYEIRAVRICDGLIDAYQSRNHTVRVAMKHLERALCHLQRYQKEQNFQQRAKYLIDSEGDYRTAADLLVQCQSHQQALVARHGLARIYMDAWLFYNVPSQNVVRVLEATEATADILRRELSALGSLEALLHKRRFSARPLLADLYAWSCQITLEEENFDGLWQWSQKRKARSVSDMLGLGVLMPETIKQAVSADLHAKTLLDELTALTSTLITTSESERAYIRQRLDDTESKLRQNSAFKDFMALRDGAVSNIAQLHGLHRKDQALNADRSVIFIDWVAHRENLYMLVKNCADKATCQCFLLHLTLADVGTWIQQHFSTKDQRRECLKNDMFEASDAPMRALDGLIARLATVTKRGDLLILSPTNTLASLPLHALGIADSDTAGLVPLLERNPVVYASSLPVLEVCLSRSLERSEPTSSIYLGVFDHPAEAKRIYDQLGDIALSTKGRSFTGSEVRKSAFTDYVKDSTLIHYHGHCSFKADEVLEQSLVLAAPMPDDIDKSLRHDEVSSGPSPSSPARAEIRGPRFKEMDELMLEARETTLLQLSEADKATHLTVEDIFKLQLASPLVVLIACDSASQTLSAGDEPLGLIAGLLCAGAASVIGALWPIPSGAGRAFTSSFYTQLHTCGSGLVDLAVALQEAVLTIKDDQRTAETYYWGGFCLHGSWIHRM